MIKFSWNILLYCCSINFVCDLIIISLTWLRKITNLSGTQPGSVKTTLKKQINERHKRIVQKVAHNLLFKNYMVIKNITVLSETYNRKKVNI